MKQFLLIASALFVICIFMITGCVFEKSEVPIAQDTCVADNDSISYQLHIVPILTTNCNNPEFGTCHQSITDGGIGFDYTTYEGIKAEVDNGALENRVIKLRDMPPSSTAGPQTLSSCDLKIIQKWINEGGPNN